MATQNPRISVMLKPSTAAVLKRMSALTRNSQSAIIGELLSAQEPVFERVVRVLEAAEAAQAQVKDRVRENLEAAEAVLDKQLGLMLGDLETRPADLVDGLEQVSRRRTMQREVSRAMAGAPGADRGPGLPPTSNRGVRYPQPIEKEGNVKRRSRKRGSRP